MKSKNNYFCWTVSVLAVLLVFLPTSAVVYAADKPSVKATKDPNGDADQDGLMNGDEIEADTDPEVANEDGDGKDDSEDGWAHEAALAPDRVPIRQYGVIDLGLGWPLLLNEKLQTVIQRNSGTSTFHFWDEGVIQPIQAGGDPIWVDDLNNNGELCGLGPAPAYKVFKWVNGAGTLLPWKTNPAKHYTYPDEIAISYGRVILGNGDVITLQLNAGQTTSAHFMDSALVNLTAGSILQTFFFGEGNVEDQYDYTIPGPILANRPTLTAFGQNFVVDLVDRLYMGEMWDRIGVWQGSFTQLASQTTAVGVNPDGHILAHDYDSPATPSFFIRDPATSSYTKYLFKSPQMLGDNVSELNLSAPLSLNKNMQMAYGESVWQNYKMYKLTDLCNAVSGQDAEYEGISVNRISNKGFLVGTSVKKSDEEPHALMLFPIEVKDVKNVGDITDDVILKNIPPQRVGESNNSYVQRELDDRQIAYIEPHRSTQDDEPEMPHIVAKIPEAPHEWKVKWRMEIEYRRANGYTSYYTQNADFTMPEDKVCIPTVPANATPIFSPEMAADAEWRIFETPDWASEIAQRGFFGGTAKIYVWFTNLGQDAPTVPTFTFRIGGKNPIELKAKTFINSIAGTDLWFAYAIARHESEFKAKENGEFRHYNQFFSDYHPAAIGDASTKDMSWVGWAKGWPTFNMDRVYSKKTDTFRINGPGGYGLFQVTIGPKKPNQPIGNGQEGYIKRKEIWNWKDNSRRAIVELQQKKTSSTSLYNALTATYPASGAIPNEKAFTGLEALIISSYNGLYGGDIKYLPVNGFTRPQGTCWEPVGNTWRFLKNDNNYVFKVDAAR